MTDKPTKSPAKLSPKAEETITRFEFTIQQSPEAVFWLDRHGRFSYVNNQACVSLGYTQDELLSLYLWDIDPDEGKKRLFELRDLSKGALAEMRALLLELRPAALAEAELPSLLQQLRNWLPRWQQLEVVSGLGISLRPAESDGSRTQRELQLEDQLLVLRQENETLIERLGVQERLLRMVAHELGHNFNACHTHQTCNGGTPIDCCYTGACCGGSGSGCSSASSSSTGTVMSYCHLWPGGLSNITTFFHPEIQDDMQTEASAHLPVYTNVGTTICLGVENSTGAGALLVGTGSCSIGSNDLMLTCSSLPTGGSGTTAMILNSTGPAGVVANPAAGGVASDGMLCIGTASNGATFGRHINDIYMGTAGTFTRAIDATDLPHPPAPPYSVAIASGETWYFQVWYRDEGPAGRSNFSSAVSVTFGP